MDLEWNNLKIALGVEKSLGAFAALVLIVKRLGNQRRMLVGYSQFKFHHSTLRRADTIFDYLEPITNILIWISTWHFYNGL